MSEVQIVHVPEQDRWEAVEGEGEGKRSVGFLSYEMRGDVIDLQHTVVDPAHRHHGLGAMLVEEALRTFRADRMMVRPTCPFVADFIAEHEEYQNLLAPSLTVEDTGERS